MIRDLFRSYSRQTARRPSRPLRPTLEVLEDRLAPAAVHWINTSGGDWSDPTNWSTGTIPGASDDVLIDVAGNLTVTHSSGTDSVLSLVSQQNLTVTGNSSLTVTGALSLTAGHTLTADQGAFAAGGAATIDEANISAQNGGTISLPGASAYNGSVGPGTTLRADGVGSQLDLSGITQLIGAGGSGDINRVTFEALNGGRLNLSHVTGLASGNAGFSARGSSSQIDLSALTGFTGARNDANSLEATGSSTIIAPGLTAVTNVSLFADGSGTLPTGQISAFVNSQVFVSGGASLTFPRLTTLDASVGAGKTLRADGTGSQLNLSAVTRLVGAGGSADVNRVAFEAFNGGRVDLSRVTGISSGNASFTVQDNNSRIDLSALTTFAGARNDSNFLQATTSGTILLSSTTTLTNVTVVIDPTSQLTVSTLQLATGSILTFVSGSGATTLTANLVNDGEVRTLTPTDSLTITGTCTQTRGSVTGTGTLTISGLFTWAGGSLSGGGVINANGGLVLNGSATRTLDADTFNNAGMATWTGSADLVMGDGAVFNNLAAATFDVQTDQSIPNTLGGTATFSNAGTFRKSAGTGTTTVQAVFTSTGPVQISSGTLSLTGGGSNSGSVSNTGTLSIGMGVTFTISGAYSGAGSLVVSLTGQLNLTGSFSNLSGTTLTNGTYFVGGILQLPNASIVTNSATVILDGPASQIVDQSGNDALANLAANTATGNFLVLDGRNFRTVGGFNNGGGLGVGAGGTLVISGPLANFSGTTLTGGTYLVTGTFQFPGANIVTNASTLLLDGPNGMIIDELGNNALAGFANNASGGLLSVQNNRPFTTAGNFSNDGTVAVSAGGVFTVNGLFSQTGGTNVQLGGTLVLAGGGSAGGVFLVTGTVSVASGITFTATGSWTQIGTVSVPATASLILAGSFANFAGTTLSSGTYQIGGTFQFVGGNIVTNAATLVLDGPSSAILDDMGNDALAGFATNTASGSFTIQNGRNLTTTGAFSDSGLLIAGANSTFTVSGSYSQSGTLAVAAGGTLSLLGAFSNFASNTLTGGTYQIGGTFRFVGANIVTNAATVVLDGTAAGILDDMGRNALAGFATNAASGSFTLQNGRTLTTAAAFSNAGSVTVGAGSTLSVGGAWRQTGGNTTLAGGTVAASGLVDIQRGVLGGTGTINANVRNADVVTVGTSNTLTINGTYTQTGGSTTLTGGTVTVSGLVDIQAGVLSGSGTINANVRNAGSVSVDIGNTLTFSGTYTQISGANTILTGGTLTASGLVDIQGGVLGGVGTISANVRNGGEVDPGALGSTGQLTITGNYTQTVVGMLNIEVAGPIAATGYSQLAISGLATLAGTLNVNLINGYVPAHGASFQIVTFGGGRGGTTFDTVNVDPSLLPPTYNANDVTIVAR